MDKRKEEKMEKIDLSRFSDEHLKNRINFFKRRLVNIPLEQVYIGDSDAAEDAVEAENRANEILAEEITWHIRDMEKELKKRRVK